MAKSTINNIEINIKGGFVLVSVNPKIYNMDIVYSAAYSLIDKAWVIIDGHPEEEIFVEIKPKHKMNLEELGRIFNEELLNYAFYKTMAQQNQEIRESIVRRAFLTNAQEMQPEVCEPQQPEQELSYLDDPLGIAKPWTAEKIPKSKS